MSTENWLDDDNYWWSSDPDRYPLPDPFSGSRVADPNAIRICRNGDLMFPAMIIHLPALRTFAGNPTTRTSRKRQARMSRDL